MGVEIESRQGVCEAGAPSGPITSVVDCGGGTIGYGAYDSGVGFVGPDGVRRTLGHHDHLVNHVAADPTGRFLASSSSDYTVGIWDLALGRRVARLDGHSDDVEAFTFLSDGYGVSASRDSSLIVWDLDNQAPIHRLRGHESDALSVSTDGQQIYSSGDDMTLRVWDAASGVLNHTFGPFTEETDTCDVDVARGRAVLGCDDGCVRVFDIERATLAGEISAHRSGIKKVAVSTTGHIFSAAYDQHLLVWDPESHELVAELDRPPGVWERSLSWGRDGTSVFAGTFDGGVISWSIA
jgi:WD40 repeat protein